MNISPLFTSLLLWIFVFSFTVFIINKATTHWFLKGLYLAVEIHSICWNSLEIFNFPKWLYHYTFLPTAYDTSSCCACSPTLWIISLQAIVTHSGAFSLIQWFIELASPRLPQLLQSIIAPCMAACPQSYTEYKLRDSCFWPRGYHCIQACDSCQKLTCFSKWGRTHCISCGSCPLLADLPHWTFDHFHRPPPAVLLSTISGTSQLLTPFLARVLLRVLLFKCDQPTLATSWWPLKLISFIFSTSINHL